MYVFFRLWECCWAGFQRDCDAVVVTGRKLVHMQTHMQCPVNWPDSNPHMGFLDHSFFVGSYLFCIVYSFSCQQSQLITILFFRLYLCFGMCLSTGKSPNCSAWWQTDRGNEAKWGEKQEANRRVVVPRQVLLTWMAGSESDPAILSQSDCLSVSWGT